MIYKKISGIYRIRNLINNKIYIGSAIILDRRKHEHFHFLINNRHHSIYLQNSYNKHGRKNFAFEVIEIVDDPKELIKREQYYLDLLKPKYNISKKAGNQYGFRHSKETKKKLSNNQFKGKLGKDSPFAKECFQYGLDGKFIRKWDSISDIERQLKLSNSLIVRCLKGKTKTAHKFQWFYKFQGEIINSRIIKQRK